MDKCVVCGTKVIPEQEYEMVSGEPVCQSHVDGDQLRVCTQCGRVYEDIHSNSTGNNCGSENCVD